MLNSIFGWPVHVPFSITTICFQVCERCVCVWHSHVSGGKRNMIDIHLALWCEWINNKRRPWFEPFQTSSVWNLHCSHPRSFIFFIYWSKVVTWGFISIEKTSVYFLSMEDCATGDLWQTSHTLADGKTSVCLEFCIQVYFKISQQSETWTFDMLSTVLNSYKGSDM